MVTALLLTSAVLVSGCGGGPSGLAGTDGIEPEQQRSLVLVARGEPETVAARGLTRMSSSFTTIPRLFNAGLVIIDGQEVPRPYLAQQLPQLQGDTWRVSPDGRMETTYLLRPNLVWHDGAPLSAEDFVFAWRVYGGGEAGPAGAAPISEIEDMLAADTRTLIIRWKRLYANAGTLEAGRFQALPRHRLELLFGADQAEAFARLPFWTSDYVGLGPYRLVHWEPGSFLDASRFDAHAGGRPKIERIRALFMNDLNAVLTALQAGEAQVAVDNAVRFRQGAILKREWSPKGSGTVLVIPGAWRRAEAQHRPDQASPLTILDVRVRKALAHSLDRAALNDALFEGEATLADSFVPPTVEYFAVVDRVVAKYPHDARRAQKLMNEVGFSKGTDGIYAHPVLGRFAGEIRVTATPQAETEVEIMADAWHRAGFDLREAAVPPAQSRLGEVRAAFPTLYTVSGSVGGEVPSAFASRHIASSENRWTGSNRGGWSHPEYDRIFEAFSQSLDRTERTSQLAEMARLLTNHVAAISLYFNPGIVAYAATVQGPGPFAPTSDLGWNIHQWEWASSPIR